MTRLGLTVEQHAELRGVDEMRALLDVGVSKISSDRDPRSPSQERKQPPQEPYP